MAMFRFAGTVPLNAMIIPTLCMKRQRLSRSKAAKGAKLESGSS